MTALISLAEAKVLLLEGVAPLATETVALVDAGGRILAADVRADRDHPPHPVSAMDGYALRSVDARKDGMLTVIGESPAGAPFAGIVGPGQCVRIATGGVVPEGADRIVIQEEVVRDEDRVRIVEEPSPASYVRAAGLDFRNGTAVARAGEALTPARLALIAATGAGRVVVRRRPRVAILPSGDELREPGEPLEAGAIPNSGAYAIAELVKSWGAEPVRSSILPDDRQRCAKALEAADLACDVIVPLGGASVGDRDALRPLFEAMGARPVFYRIAVIPGKPSWHARFDDGRLVIGLPGNPASAFVCAHLLLKPMIQALSGRLSAGEDETCAGLLDAKLPANGAREAFMRGEAWVDSRGCLRVRAFPNQDSSLISPLAAANALIRRKPGAPALPPGGEVELLLVGPIVSAP